jgi:hypothetical protein
LFSVHTVWNRFSSVFVSPLFHRFVFVSPFNGESNESDNHFLPKQPKKHKKFKTIFDRAVLEGLLDKNPFKGVKLINDTARRERLNIAQVRQLAEFSCPEQPVLSLYTNIFLFSVFTGLTPLSPARRKVCRASGWVVRHRSLRR